jgi:hypothetical protein
MSIDVDTLTGRGDGRGRGPGVAADTAEVLATCSVTSCNLGVTSSGRR